MSRVRCCRQRAHDFSAIKIVDKYPSPTSISSLLFINTSLRCHELPKMAAVRDDGFFSSEGVVLSSWAGLRSTHVPILRERMSEIQQQPSPCRASFQWPESHMLFLPPINVNSTSQPCAHLAPSKSVLNKNMCRIAGRGLKNENSSASLLLTQTSKCYRRQLMRSFAAS